jgi:hypothetical protein
VAVESESGSEFESDSDLGAAPEDLETEDRARGAGFSWDGRLPPRAFSHAAALRGTAHGTGLSGGCFAGRNPSVALPSWALPFDSDPTVPDSFVVACRVHSRPGRETPTRAYSALLDYPFSPLSLSFMRRGATVS